MSQLHDSLSSLDLNKPDFHELDLGSPVSPLRPSRGPTPTPTPSTSTSSGSFSGSLTRVNPNPQPKSNVDHHLTTSAISPSPNSLPAGNICPSGRILIRGMVPNRNCKTDVLGSGTGNYGHGSIMRCCGGVGPARPGLDPEELKRMGNEMYKRGCFGEALGFYEKAIGMDQGNAAYRSNRAAALVGLGRVGEAVREWEEAVRLDPEYWRAHRRLGSLFIRLGLIDNAKRHLCIPGQQPDPTELQKLQTIEKFLSKCSDARKANDWRSALREGEAAVAAGADYSPQLFLCRAEALLKLQQLEDAESCLSNIPKLEPCTNSYSQTRFFGILSEAYPFLVRAQIDMALGRFDSAVSAAEKAGQIDPRSVEVSVILNNVRLVTRARTRGNDLFKSDRFTEACSAYGEGLRLDPANSVLYCNRAACWFKLGMWNRSVDDCNQALRIQPNYTKALLRRAASNSKLERWDEAVRDYEVLRRELPDDKEVAKSLFDAQVLLKRSYGEDVYNMKFGGDVEQVSGFEQFRNAISSPGVSVVHFKSSSNLRCKQMSPFVDTLCGRYPSISFLKVDIEENATVANAEKVRIVPTFKIYKSGALMKEIVCPSCDVLETSVRHYSF